jgi:lysophospholipase L1-like esterase
MPRVLHARRVAAVAAAALVTAALVAGPSTAQAAGRHHPAAASRYVALGDSYASGEGLRPYEAGTATATDRCHRSAHRSYPERLQATSLRAFNRLISVACSGAGTAGLLDAPKGADEPAQLASLTSKTKTVTLTIGGNDAGFAGVLADCLYSPVAQTQAYLPGVGRHCEQKDDKAVSARISALGGGPAQFGTVSISTILTLIHAASPRATIYVTGYPQLFGTKPSNDFGCQVSRKLPIFILGTDVTWIRSKTTELNAAIKSGVETASGLGIKAHYVDVAKPFGGHGLCDAHHSWIKPLLLTLPDPADPSSVPSISSASFHPTGRGQRVWARAIAAEASWRPWKWQIPRGPGIGT